MKIKSAHINNYRSLVDFNVNSFDDTVIFYGENNAGKSNVLSFLSLIFQRKRKTPNEKVQNFYEGLIENFANNFYKNESDSIDFNIKVEADVIEIDIDETIKKFIKSKPKNIFDIVGRIIRVDRDTAQLVISKIKFNQDVIYLRNETINYFPKIKSKSIDTSLLSAAFTKLIDPLNDCVSIISSNRDMQTTLFSSDPVESIEPRRFKNFMHSLYLSENKHQIFEKINTVFNRPPFSFGEISFASENGNLELMIKENEFRLPIKHLGSGVLQTLYIIASIIYHKHKIICIEELEQNFSSQRQRDTLRKLQTMINDQEIGDLQQIILSSHSPVFSSSKLGLIYFLDKKDGMTFIDEVRTRNEDIKNSPHMKKYFIQSMHSQDSYTPEEYAEAVKENMEREERLLRR